MEVLGIGPMELILILIVALMVFGPDKLPQIGAKLGRAMRDMRRATRAISEEINSTRAAIEAPAKELAEPFQEVAGAAKAAGSLAAAVRNPGQAIRESVLRELNSPIEPQTPVAPAASDQNRIEITESGQQPQPDTIAANPADVVEPAPTRPAPEEPLPALPAPDDQIAPPVVEPLPDQDEDSETPVQPDSLPPTSPEQ